MADKSPSLAATLHDSVRELLDAVGKGASVDALELAESIVGEAEDVRNELRYQLQWRPQALAGFTPDEVEAADRLAGAAGLDVVWVISSTAAIQASYQVAIDRGEEDPQQLTCWRQTVRHRVAHREQDRINQHERRRQRGR